jgi:hypothetical protein
MGFGALRVINDDRIAPATGFGAHTHTDMEIITIVTEGTVTHEDSMGNTGTVSAGEVQVMSAGTGVTHSEFNRSPDVPLSLFQIWIQPDVHGVSPRYAQKSFTLSQIKNGATLVVSTDGREGSLSIHQGAFISLIALTTAHPIDYELKKKENGVYFFVTRGSVVIDDVRLGERDAVGVSGTEAVSITTPDSAQLLVIEVPLGV